MKEFTSKSKTWYIKLDSARVGWRVAIYLLNGGNLLHEKSKYFETKKEANKYFMDEKSLCK